MKIYIATPVTSRPEKSPQERLAAARHRIELLKEILADEPQFKDCEFCGTFDIPRQGSETEEHILATCVELVLTSDAIYLDHAWNSSKGCNLEYRAAKIYGKKIYEFDKLD